MKKTYKESWFVNSYSLSDRAYEDLFSIYPTYKHTLYSAPVDVVVLQIEHIGGNTNIELIKVEDYNYYHTQGSNEFRKLELKHDTLNKHCENLEQQVDEQKKEIVDLNTQILDLRGQNQDLEDINTELKKINSELESRIKQVERKETPMAPQHYKTTIDDDEEIEADRYYCNNCCNSLYIGADYCDFCGQKLDWLSLFKEDEEHESSL